VKGGEAVKDKQLNLAALWRSECDSCGSSGSMGCRKDTHEEFLSEISRSGVKIMANNIGGTCSTHVKSINEYTVLVVKPERRYNFRILKDYSRIVLKRNRLWWRRLGSSVPGLGPVTDSYQHGNVPCCSVNDGKLLTSWAIIVFWRRFQFRGYNGWRFHGNVYSDWDLASCNTV
jgi:hypothetical protein